ncbi:MAG: response regulator [Ferruginibacter sp.]
MNPFAPEKPATLIRKVLVVEDNLSMRDNFSRKLRNCNCIPSLIEDPKSFTEIIAAAVFEPFTDILIDVNLSDYEDCEPINSISNGIDIANILRRFLPPNVSISIITTNIDSPGFQKSIEEMEYGINIFDKKEPKIYEAFFDSEALPVKPASLWNNCINRNPKDIFSLFGDFAWFTVTDNVIRKDGFGPLLKQIDEGFLSQYKIEISRSSDQPVIEENSDSYVFWNFSSLSNIDLLFGDFFWKKEYQVSENPIGRMFNIQAGISLAQYYVEAVDRDLTKYLAKLSDEGLFNFQKFCLLNMYKQFKNDTVSLEMYEFKIRSFRTLVKKWSSEIKDLYIGTIQNIELESQSVWTNLYNITDGTSKSEPLWKNLLDDSNIDVYPGASFYYIISKHEVYGLARKIEAI